MLFSEHWGHSPTPPSKNMLHMAIMLSLHFSLQFKKLHAYIVHKVVCAQLSLCLVLYSIHQDPSAPPSKVVWIRPWNTSMQGIEIR